MKENKQDKKHEDDTQDISENKEASQLRLDLSQEPCKDGLQCDKVSFGQCMYFHEPCKRGVYCPDLRHRKCKYYHQECEFKSTQNFFESSQAKRAKLDNDIDDDKHGNGSDESSIISTEFGSRESTPDIIDSSINENYSYNQNESLSLTEQSERKDNSNKDCINRNNKKNVHSATVTVDTCRSWNCPYIINYSMTWGLTHAGRLCLYFCHLDSEKPFSSGSSHLAYFGHYCQRAVSWHNKIYGQKCVIKKCKNRRILGFQNTSLFDQDIKACKTAQKLINKWNKISKINTKYRILKPIITKSDRMDTKDGNNDGLNNNEIAHSEYIMVENFLKGEFRKWNSNSGWFEKENASIQAFCHWTYHYSEGKYLFCDAQGVRKRNEYIITDPCILSWKGNEYGTNDCGRDYIISWFENHKCNQFCESRWIRPPSIQKKQKLVVVQKKTTTVWSKSFNN